MSIELDLPYSVIERPGDDNLGTVPEEDFEGVSYPPNSKPGQNDQPDTPEPARDPQADSHQAAQEDKIRARATKKAEVAFGGDDEDLPWYAK